LSPAAPSENREQRRAEIVGAALRLLEEGGLDRLSLRRVALVKRGLGGCHGIRQRRWPARPVWRLHHHRQKLFHSRADVTLRLIAAG